jgi:hypothetical protein
MPEQTLSERGLTTGTLRTANGSRYSASVVSDDRRVGGTIIFNLASPTPNPQWAVNTVLIFFSSVINGDQYDVNVLSYNGPNQITCRIAAILRSLDDGIAAYSDDSKMLVPADALTQLGVGINIITSSQCSQAFAPIADKNIETKPDGSQNRIKKVVKDSQSASEAYHFAASISGSGLLNSASASIDLQKSFNFSSTTYSMVVMSQVTTEFLTTDVTNFSITNEAADCLKSRGIDEFVKTYGTHYVSALVKGGYAAGTINVETRTTDDQKSISASLNVSSTEFIENMSASASFNEELKSASASYSLAAMFYNNGQSVDVNNLSDPDAMAKADDDFVANIVKNPSETNVIWARISPYSAVPKIQEILSAMGKPDGLNFTFDADIVSDLATAYSSLDYLEGSCRQVLKLGSYATPAQSIILQRQIDRIEIAKAAITSLDVKAVQSLTVDQATKLDPSVAIGGIVNPTCNRGAAFYVESNLDQAHTPSGVKKQIVSVPYYGDPMPEGITFDSRTHETYGKYDGDTDIGLFYRLDDEYGMFYSYLNFNGANGSNQLNDGNVVSLSDTSGTRQISRVVWMNWPDGNYANISLADGSEML